MTLATDLLSQAKTHTRIDHTDEDAALLLLIAAAIADVSHAAGYAMPPALTQLPDDLAFAICDQVAMIYDARGAATDRPIGLSLAASRICARYRGVSLGAVE